jgi:hypothetical protein
MCCFCWIVCWGVRWTAGMGLLVYASYGTARLLLYFCSAGLLLWWWQHTTCMWWMCC